MSSMYAVLQVCDKMANEKSKDSNLTTLTHAVVLFLSGNRELNLKRRDLLRHDLNKQYAALCNPATPISTFLFGDDLNKEVEDLTKANKLSKKVTTPKRRPEPYRIPSGQRWRGRGRSDRGFSRGRGSRTASPFLGSGRGYTRGHMNRQGQTSKTQ